MNVSKLLLCIWGTTDFQENLRIAKGSYKGSSKDAGMIILKIKRINRTVARPANPVQSVPSVLGKRKVGDLCVGCVCDA